MYKELSQNVTILSSFFPILEILQIEKKRNERKHQVETQYNRYCALKFNKRILECDSAFLSGMVPLNTCLNAWRTLKGLNEVFLRYFTFLSPSKRNSIAPEITDLRTHHGE